MSDDIWDDPDLQVDVYAKFKRMGDNLSGEILSIEKKAGFPDDNGRNSTRLIPHLIVRTESDEEVILAAGQLDLRMQLLQLRPRVGDHIYVELTNNPRPGDEKKFKVEINK